MNTAGIDEKMEAAFREGKGGAIPSSGAIVALVLFAVMWGDLLRQLSYVWSTRDQYGYGYFVPVFAAALCYLRWLDRPDPLPPEGQPSRWARAVLFAALASAAALLLPLRVVYEINPDWPLVAWPYAAIVTGLTLFACYIGGGAGWVRHFAFPIFFILVAVPWPYRIEKGLTVGLMHADASIAVELVRTFGIAAMQRGNLIEVGQGVVGVDEACSGIRSFQSTLMAGLLMGELYRLRAGTRAGLVIAGLCLAFLLNIVRTALLTVEAAYRGVGAVAKWHDPAGLTILAGCLLCLWALAAWLRKRSGNAVPDRSLPAAPLPASSKLRVRRFLAGVGTWAIIIIVINESWYRFHEAARETSPDWTISVPRENPSFREIELSKRASELLSSDHTITGEWVDPGGARWNVFFFRWEPRSVKSVIYSRNHRPDVCLNAAGLRQLADHGSERFEIHGLDLPFRRYTYEADGQIVHVFFCQWDNGSSAQRGLQSSRQAGRLASVLTGRRKLGQQTLEIIRTGDPSIEQADSAVKSYLPELIRIRGAESAQFETGSERVQGIRSSAKWDSL